LLAACEFLIFGGYLGLAERVGFGLS